jgi:hypothetical protein
MDSRSGSRRGPTSLAVVCLAGMAFCHVADVGMKFDEHVYYMGGLFLANIAASLALIPVIGLAEARFPAARRPAWAAAAGLAALTIAGFLYSRTIGFPQMEDHVGEWNALGLTSLAFEATIVVVSVGRLRALERDVTGPAPVQGVSV